MKPSFISPERRWGEGPAEERLRLSGIAVLAALIATFSLACGLLAGLIPARTSGEGLGRLVSLTLLGLSLTTFPLGMLLSYLGLWRCRLDGPLMGRRLAWFALGVSYLSLLAWYSQWAAFTHPLAPLGLFGIAALVLLHLLVFAAESHAGRSMVVGLVIGGALFAVASCWLYRSIEDARRIQVQHNLMRTGKALHEKQELHPLPPSRKSLPATED